MPSMEGIRRWEILEGIRPFGWSPHEWVMYYIMKEVPQNFLAFATMKVQGEICQSEEGPLMTRWYPDLRVPGSRAVRNKFVIYKLPSL